MISTKSFRAEVKAYDAAKGTFEAIVSVFGNVDYGGDRVMPGAFAKTLADWDTSGDPIPVIWSHEWNDPASHIGWVEKAEEREEGLWVRAQLDIEANEKAAYVARLLKQRRITQFSFGYEARDYRTVKDPDGTTVRELTEISLFEVGPTLLGMNPDTVLLEAASRGIADAKEGRAISTKDEESLRQARDLIDTVLSQMQAATEDDAPVEDASAATKSVTDQPAEEETSEPATDLRDSAPTINNELQMLLARPRHTQET